ncbi:hypothetical protein B7992_11490 [Fibrobacter sp. UWH1]|nr:hypothetical protein B7992_11490 [Fibrobacter sp. UWH1]
MNKFLVFLVSTTILIWGVFLFKMSDKVDGQQRSGLWAVYEGNPQVESQDIETRLDFKSLLARLKPQLMPSGSARDPFCIPASLFPVVAKPRVVTAKTVEVPDSLLVGPKPKPKPPSITLDAVLPGDNPVAIIKFRGESSVVRVGQEIWDVVVESIRPDGVELRFGEDIFTIR